MSSARAHRSLAGRRPMTIAVIGGGLMGVSLAYFLSRAGHRVVLYKASDQIGGLAGTIRLGDVEVDRFYHTILSSDTHMQALAHELGLTDRLRFRATGSAFFHQGRLYPMTTVWSLEQTGREGFPEPVAPAVFGVLVYPDAEPIARRLGVGLYDAKRGEIVPPPLAPVEGRRTARRPPPPPRALSPGRSARDGPRFPPRGPFPCPRGRGPVRQNPSPRFRMTRGLRGCAARFGGPRSAERRDSPQWRSVAGSAAARRRS